jgi:hypothetical protein
MGRLGAFLLIFVTALAARTAAAGPVTRGHLNARHVPSAFRHAVVELLEHTKQPVVLPGDMGWARIPGPYLGCAHDVDRDQYSYYIIASDPSATCAADEDPMFYLATLDVAPWNGPFWNYDMKVDLGRGIDGDVSLATGFDDPVSPRTDNVTWHVGRTSFLLSVGSGDGVALARSIVANLAVVPPSHELTAAPPIGIVAAQHVEPGLAQGVAVLRRRPTVPIEVPRSPAIERTTHLYVSSHDTDGYAYFLCRTVACSPEGGVVAEVSAERVDRHATREALDVDLSCGYRGHFQGQIADAGAVPSSFAIVTWRQGTTGFTILSALNNPARTDVVALARSMTSNACPTKKSREP